MNFRKRRMFKDLRRKINFLISLYAFIMRLQLKALKKWTKYQYFLFVLIQFLILSVKILISIHKSVYKSE